MCNKGNLLKKDSHHAEVRFKAETLFNFTKVILIQCGMPEADAHVTADCLISANLRGIDTHGVIRLKLYVDRIRAGGNNPKPSIRTIRDSTVSAVLDGDNSLGPVGGSKAMQLAIEKAQNTGVGIVTIKNSNHYGAASYYSMMALPYDMIGISMTNVLPSMPPTGGADARLGNNPFSLAFPTGEEPPVVMDYATSLASWGQVFTALQTDESLPEGCYLDKDGKPTTNPQDVYNGGLLLPIASYKGYGIALAISIFTGLLADGAFDTDIPHPYKYLDAPGQNSFFMSAIRVDQFVPVGSFKRRMDEVVRLIRSTKLSQGADRIYLPGEKEYETANERSANGIPLNFEMIEELNTLAREVGLLIQLEV